MLSIEQEKAFVPEGIVHTNSALQVLAEMPPVEGNELDFLLAKFHEAVDRVTTSDELFAQMCGVLHDINPNFSPEEYSSLPEADVLANVVAGLYAPLIHGFSKTIIENIEDGKLPAIIVAPPRDTIPLVTSFETLREETGRDLTILKPPITRKTAGIHNNQSDELAKQDPLFDLLINQTFNGFSVEDGVTEIETGIYSTTSFKTAVKLKKLGVREYVALKFYGLGPNLSYIHALLSKGLEWVAEDAERYGAVDAAQIAQLMVLLDSMEELGMQNVYQSVSRLCLSASGKVEPVIHPVDERTFEIARATNQAIGQTAKQYLSTDCLDLSLKILDMIPRLVRLSRQGYPFMLESPIPPMDNKEEHFANIRGTQIFDYPRLRL